MPEQLQFLQPGWLMAALVPLVLALLATRLPALAHLPAMHAGIRLRHTRPECLAAGTGRRDLRHAAPLQALALSLFMLALAQPVHLGRRLPQPPPSLDIHFIVDASVSMILRDYVVDGQRVDRMTVLRQSLDHFVDQLQGERISIMVFGEHALTLVPPTWDTHLARRMIRRIEPGIAGRFNGMGDALALAASQIPTQRQRRQILVLMTDADKDTGHIPPLQAAALAARRKLPVYTIAIGSGRAEAAEQRTVGLVYEPADLQRLSRIAALTGGQAYQARDKQALDAAIAAIRETERKPVRAAPRFEQQPLYMWPLLAGLALLTLLQLRGLPGGWRS